MNQNRSSAVMQQRAEPHDSLDDFPTPPWATRALCEFLQNPWDEMDEQGPSHAPTTWPMTVREPAANRGYMARPLADYFGQVEAGDIHDYGMGYPVGDYLFGPLPQSVDWTITNPPFRLAEQFIERALASSRQGVAVIVRAAFLEGQARYRSLFSVNPPAAILQFTERVVMHRGRVTADGSTATAYAWLVWTGWIDRQRQTEFRWIAPCRKRLERPGDYDVWPKAVAA